MKLVHRLQQERERRGWSQGRVADLLGTTVSAVASWEEGIALPSLYFRDELCTLFHMDAHMLGLLPEASEEASASSSYTFFFLPQSMSPESDPPSPETGIFDPLVPVPMLEGYVLVGRDSLLQEIKRQACSSKNIALHGLPGIGKTALAARLAHDQEIRTHFYDGVLWAGLGPRPHVTAILSRWGKLLGMTSTVMETLDSREAWTTALRTAIGTRRMLLVIDDTWEIDETLAFQVGGPECTYVITTRFARIASTFASDNTVTVPELDDSAGIALLAHFAPKIVEHDQEAAHTLVRAVGGLPLGLTLMGRYLGTQAYFTQPRRLSTALKKLRDAEHRLQLSMPQSPLERPLSLPTGVPLSLQSVLAVSDQHLAPQASRALHALSILPAKPDSFSIEAALEVTFASIETLESICDAGLLEKSSPGRYTMHRVVTDYARTFLQDTDVYARLITYTVHFVAHHTTDSEALEQNSATIITALEYAWEQNRSTELIRGVNLFVPFLYMRGLYPLAEYLLQQAHQSAKESTDVQGIIHCSLHLGNIMQKHGNYTQAETYYQAGLALAYPLEDYEQTSRLFTGLGEVAKERGNYEEAKMYYQAGLALARPLQDYKQSGRLLTGLGGVAYEQGDYIQAEAYYQEGLALAQQLEDQEQIGTQLKNLGVLARKRGDYTQAETYYQAGLTLARSIGHRDLTSILLMNLGGVAKERGNYVLAEACYQESLVLARQMGHRERISVLLSNLGVIADAKGDYAQAEDYLHKGLTLAREVGHRERISLLLLNLGVVADRQGQHELAETYYQEALSLARQIGHRERISLLLLNLGALNKERDDTIQAEVYYQEGLTLARQLGHRERISDLLLHLGVLATKQGNDGKAERYLHDGLTLARQIANPQLLCIMLAAWGELYLKQQKRDAAEKTFREMLDLVPAGSQTLLAQALYGLACVAAASQNIVAARKYAQHSLTIFASVGHRKTNMVRVFLETLSALEDQESTKLERGNEL